MQLTVRGSAVAPGLLHIKIIITYYFPFITQNGRPGKHATAWKHWRSVAKDGKFTRAMLGRQMFSAVGELVYLRKALHQSTKK